MQVQLAPTTTLRHVANRKKHSRVQGRQVLVGSHPVISLLCPSLFPCLTPSSHFSLSCRQSCTCTWSYPKGSDGRSISPNEDNEFVTDKVAPLRTHRRGAWSSKKLTGSFGKLA